MGRAEWSDERIERLRTMFSEGLSSSVIAARFNAELPAWQRFTRNSICGKLMRLGLQRKGVPVSEQRLIATPSTGQPLAKSRRRPGIDAATRDALLPPLPLAFAPPPAKIRAGGRRKSSAQAFKAAAAIRREQFAAEAAATPYANGGITITGLTEFTCRWPKGDPKTPGFRYCGAKTTFEESYCPVHAALAYREDPMRRTARELARLAVLP